MTFEPQIGHSLIGVPIKPSQIMGLGGAQDIREAYGYPRIDLKLKGIGYVTTFVPGHIAMSYNLGNFKGKNPSIILMAGCMLAHLLDMRLYYYLNSPDSPILKEEPEPPTYKQAKRMLNKLGIKHVAQYLTKQPVNQVYVAGSVGPYQARRKSSLKTSLRKSVHASPKGPAVKPVETDEVPIPGETQLSKSLPKSPKISPKKSPYKSPKLIQPESYLPEPVQNKSIPIESKLERSLRDSVPEETPALSKSLTKSPKPSTPKSPYKSPKLIQPESYLPEPVQNRSMPIDSIPEETPALSKSLSRSPKQSPIKKSPSKSPKLNQLESNLPETVQNKSIPIDSKQFEPDSETIAGEPQALSISLSKSPKLSLSKKSPKSPAPETNLPESTLNKSISSQAKLIESTVPEPNLPESVEPKKSPPKPRVLKRIPSKLAKPKSFRPTSAQQPLQKAPPSAQQPLQKAPPSAQQPLQKAPTSAQQPLQKAPPSAQLPQQREPIHAANVKIDQQHVPHILKCKAMVDDSVERRIDTLSAFLQDGTECTQKELKDMIISLDDIVKTIKKPTQTPIVNKTTTTTKQAPVTKLAPPTKTGIKKPTGSAYQKYLASKQQKA